MTRFRYFNLVISLALSVLGIACSNDTTATPTVTPSATKGDPPTDDKPGFFVDVTEQSGLQAVYKNGNEAGHYAILESLGGGIGLIDYDRDGLLDVAVAGGGHYGPNKEMLGYPNRLFKNLGDFKFKDVTADVGLPTTAGPMYSHGFGVGDYNNDSWPDLLITGYGRCALYRNHQGKFEEVTAAVKLPHQPSYARPAPNFNVGHWSTSCAWCDFDADGDLDLYLEHYTDWSFDNNPVCDGSSGKMRDVCSPKRFNGLPDQLYRNNGDGSFTDVGKEAGLRKDMAGNDKGLGVLVVDVNDDGKPDIYVANDTTDNYLYINKGHLKFEEVAVKVGAARDGGSTPNGSMGVDAGDYDGSGRFSIFVTNYQHEVHALYRNLGLTQGDAPNFYHSSEPAGIKAIGLIYVGFGTGFIDYDLDGNEDIFIANGHVVFDPPPPGELKQRPVLLHNTRKPGQEFYAVRFANVTDQGGPFLRSKHMGRGVAFGDLNNDGKQDLVICHTHEPVAILKNDVANGHHWLGIELVGKPNRDAFGAKLTLEVGNQKLTRSIRSGRSYLSSHDLRTVFGLGKETKAGKLTVRWPSGKTQTWDALAVDQYHRLEEQ